MKENIYDNDAFFDKYRQFPRSVEGLKAAGEWHAFRKLLPDFNGAHVLDIGCGFGWHCIYAAQHGAAHVTGTDISAKMLEVAREKTKEDTVEYMRVAMEDLAFSPASFDIVLSALAFHYTPDFARITKRIYSWLTDGGTFVFSVEHPVFTAYGTQEWALGKAGQREFWPVDRYFEEGARRARFLGEEVVKYHRTLTTYMGALTDAGFAICSVVEPQPAPELLESVPEMRDELRRPMMLIVRAGK